jgi:hypothetical protein
VLSGKVTTIPFLFDSTLLRKILQCDCFVA